MIDLPRHLFYPLAIRTEAIWVRIVSVALNGRLGAVIVAQTEETGGGLLGLRSYA